MAGWALGVVAAALLLPAVHARAAEPDGAPVTPAPQPALGVIIERDLTPVRELFNRLADRPRLLVLVSPT
ncbi:MAG TPA: hypothetical protein VI792_09785 [Candidatus Eisenbacteria bacterium]